MLRAREGAPGARGGSAGVRAVAGRELPGEHAGQDDDEAQGLPEGEGLREHDRAEQRGDLVTARAQGRASFYALARPELIDLLAAAERLLEAAGDAVTLCPTYGQDT